MFAFYLYMLNFLDLIVGHFDIFSNFAPRIELIGMPSSRFGVYKTFRNHLL